MLFVFLIVGFFLVFGGLLADSPAAFIIGALLLISALCIGGLNDSQDTRTVKVSAVDSNSAMVTLTSGKILDAEQLSVDPTIADGYAECVIDRALPTWAVFEDRKDIVDSCVVNPNMLK